MVQNDKGHQHKTSHSSRIRTVTSCTHRLHPYETYAPHSRGRLSHFSKSSFRWKFLRQNSRGRNSNPSGGSKGLNAVSIPIMPWVNIGHQSPIIAGRNGRVLYWVEFLKVRLWMDDASFTAAHEANFRSTVEELTETINNAWMFIARRRKAFVRIPELIIFYWSFRRSMRLHLQ